MICLALYVFSQQGPQAQISKGIKLMRKNGLIEGSVGRWEARHTAHSALCCPQLSTPLLTCHSLCSDSTQELLLASLLPPHLVLVIFTMTWDGLIKEPFPPRGTVDSQRLQEKEESIPQWYSHCYVAPTQAKKKKKTHPCLCKEI